MGHLQYSNKAKLVTVFIFYSTQKHLPFYIEKNLSGGQDSLRRALIQHNRSYFCVIEEFHPPKRRHQGIIYSHKTKDRTMTNYSLNEAGRQVVLVLD